MTVSLRWENVLTYKCMLRYFSSWLLVLEQDHAVGKDMESCPMTVSLRWENVLTYKCMLRYFSSWRLALEQVLHLEISPMAVSLPRENALIYFMYAPLFSLLAPCPRKIF